MSLNLQTICIKLHETLKDIRHKLEAYDENESNDFSSISREDRQHAKIIRWEMVGVVQRFPITSCAITLQVQGSMPRQC
jgi:hypothetical protein